METVADHLSGIRKKNNDDLVRFRRPMGKDALRFAGKIQTRLCSFGMPRGALSRWSSVAERIRLVKSCEYYVPDFSNWQDHTSYQKEFERLLRDLKTDEKTTSPFQK
jgi:hypothetical protein